MSIKNNIDKIKDTIQLVCDKNNIDSSKVKLMAVSKFHPTNEIIEAIESSQYLFGENRVQEAKDKFPTIFENYKNINLHLIGQLQTNKVKDAVKIANCIQSVDRLKLVQEIEKQCAILNKNIDIFFEIHTAEDSKSGFTSEKDFYEVMENFDNKKYPHINPKGFMTMAPFVEDEKLIHKSFEYLRLFRDKIQKEFPHFNFSELSMGMSGDFKIAIEEGSTLVRIGTAIFGERNYNK